MPASQRESPIMNGLSTIHAANVQEIVKAYRSAVEKGEAKHADNIRWAHPDLAKKFDEVDKLNTVGA